ncbi:MAG: bifunctional adenosylcobinamide kinase/adenosylcobinamide-phosphate guanylyltransferase [Clostridium sp.]|nr:bifunctional adenosylcobinamide kinase/adenosylcobinamide-phosphate guanylyltransferase [Clostridium sp.]
MLYIVTGGSGSGKSEFAENLAVDWFQRHSVKRKLPGYEKDADTGKERAAGRLFYIATMSSADAESISRIERHREQRKGKGFTTVECAVGLAQMRAGSGDVLLLEDLSNLLANEMYSSSGSIEHIGAEQAILLPILRLEKTVSCVIIVTNEIFSEGMEYDEETCRYLSTLGMLNCRLAQMADGVVELVCGIPVWHKGKR